MGKYSMSRAHYKYSGRRIDFGSFGSNAGQAMNSPYARWQISQIPIIGDWYRAADQQKFYDDYLRNTGQSWDSVKYPALLSGSNWTSAGVDTARAIPQMIISRNLMRMYR